MKPGKFFFNKPKQIGGSLAKQIARIKPSRKDLIERIQTAEDGAQKLADIAHRQDRAEKAALDLISRETENIKAAGLPILGRSGVLKLLADIANIIAGKTKIRLIAVCADCKDQIDLTDLPPPPPGAVPVCTDCGEMRLKKEASNGPN